jgi:hypothetical protein
MGRGEWWRGRSRDVEDYSCVAFREREGLADELTTSEGGEETGWGWGFNVVGRSWRSWIRRGRRSREGSDEEVGRDLCWPGVVDFQREEIGHGHPQVLVVSKSTGLGSRLGRKVGEGRGGGGWRKRSCRDGKNRRGHVGHSCRIRFGIG